MPLNERLTNGKSDRRIDYPLCRDLLHILLAKDGWTLRNVSRAQAFAPNAVFLSQNGIQLRNPILWGLPHRLSTSETISMRCMEKSSAVGYSACHKREACLNSSEPAGLKRSSDTVLTCAPETGQFSE